MPNTVSLSRGHVRSRVRSSVAVVVDNHKGVVVHLVSALLRARAERLLPAGATDASGQVQGREGRGRQVVAGVRQDLHHHGHADDDFVSGSTGEDRRQAL